MLEAYREHVAERASQNIPPKPLNAEQVAEILKISRSQTYELVRHGKLRAVRMGRLVRFRMQDVQAYIEECLNYEPYSKWE